MATDQSQTLGRSAQHNNRSECETSRGQLRKVMHEIQSRILQPY